MKTKIEITPALLSEMEVNIRNSPSYQSKIAEAKADLLRNQDALRMMFQKMKSKS